MPYRSPVRWLAPAALATVFIITLVILISAGGDGGSPSRALEPEPVTTRSTAKRATPAPRRPHFYVVQAGDVLSSIAITHGLSVERLQELNPSIDAQTLRPGQRLKLTP